MSPYLLLQNNIPVVRCTQYPGEFIINYPGMDFHYPLACSRACTLHKSPVICSLHSSGPLSACTPAVAS